MGRKPFGADRVMSILLEKDSENQGIENPTDFLMNTTGLSVITVRKYLEQLSDLGFIEFVIGGYGGKSIVRAKILKRDLEGLRAKASELHKGAQDADEACYGEARPSPPEPARVERAEKKNRPLISVLVDYDNIVGTARAEFFCISFMKLREYLRQFGETLFAEVFLSPHSSTPEVIQQLNDAGFYVIACPQGSKQKDAVDTKMIWRARDLLGKTLVQTMLIVSRDQDFRDLEHVAADCGKEVIFLNVLDFKNAISGKDVIRELPVDRNIEKFHTAIQAISSGLTGSSTDDIGLRIDFVSDIICQLVDRERASYKEFKPFNWLKSYLKDRMFKRWDGVFSLDSYREALTALVDKGALRKNVGKEFVFYTVNKEHPVVAIILRKRKPSNVAG